MEGNRSNIQNIIRLVLIAVAVGMSVASMVFGYLGTVELTTQVGLLSLGLFTLSLAVLQKTNN